MPSPEKRRSFQKLLISPKKINKQESEYISSPYTSHCTYISDRLYNSLTVHLYIHKTSISWKVRKHETAQRFMDEYREAFMGAGERVNVLKKETKTKASIKHRQTDESSMHCHSIHTYMTGSLQRGNPPTSRFCYVGACSSRLSTTVVCPMCVYVDVGVCVCV